MRPCIPVHVHILLRVFWKHAIFFLLYIQTCGFFQMLALVVNAFFRTINTPIPKPNPSKYLISQIEHEILHTYLVTHLSFDGKIWKPAPVFWSEHPLGGVCIGITLRTILIG